MLKVIYLFLLMLANTLQNIDIAFAKNTRNSAFNSQLSLMRNIPRMLLLQNNYFLVQNHSEINNYSSITLKNSGFFCWLNSALKLLFTMINKQDIRFLADREHRSQDNNTNEAQNIFIRMWHVYKDQDTEDEYTDTNNLEALKNQLIHYLQIIIQLNKTQSYSIREYFSTHQVNSMQDANLFLLAMIDFLGLNNNRHNAHLYVYIDNALESDMEYSYRKINVGSPLIIPITTNSSYNSINDYIQSCSDKITGVYNWNPDELRNINIISLKDRGIQGNKFEIAEADLTCLRSFVIYFALSSTDEISQHTRNIIKIVFNDDFPQDTIQLANNSNYLNKPKNIKIIARAMICFRGSDNAGHYICITQENNEIIIHDDELVMPIAKYISCKRHIDHDVSLKDFLEIFDFTPSSILYEVL